MRCMQQQKERTRLTNSHSALPSRTAAELGVLALPCDTRATPAMWPAILREGGANKELRNARIVFFLVTCKWTLKPQSRQPGCLGQQDSSFDCPSLQSTNSRLAHLECRVFPKASPSPAPMRRPARIKRQVTSARIQGFVTPPTGVVSVGQL